MSGPRAIRLMAAALAVAAIAALANRSWTVAGVAAALAGVFLLLAAGLARKENAYRLQPRGSRALWTSYHLATSAMIASALFVALLRSWLAGIAIGVGVGAFVAVSYARRASSGAS